MKTKRYTVVWTYSTDGKGPSAFVTSDNLLDLPELIKEKGINLTPSQYFSLGGGETVLVNTEHGILIFNFAKRY